MKDYYEILEVSNKASAEVIEKSYKVLAKKYHPDVQNTSSKYLAEETLKDINEAYSVLSDPHLRQAYDREYSKMHGSLNYENNYTKYEYPKEEPQPQKTQKQNTNKVNSSGAGIVGIIKNIIQSFKDLKNPEARKQHADEFSQKLIALGLTVVIMAAVILILWNIPLTRSWITGV